MLRQRNLNRRFGQAFASVMAIQFLAIFVALGVAFASAAHLEVQKADSLRAVTEARLAAESGLAYMLPMIRNMRMPEDTTASNLLVRLYPALDARLSAATDPASLHLDADGSEVAIASAERQLSHGTFSWKITPADVAGGGCRLTVTGTADGVSRRVSMDLTLVAKRSVIFDYGVVSAGKITVSGSAIVTGMDYPSQANILSVRAASPTVEVSDSALIGGDIYVTASTQDAVALYGSDYSVGGSVDPETIMAENVHLGVEETPLPQVDTEPFDALAVNVINSENIGDVGTELVNVRIAAGTNPLFASDMTVKGILYVESPNTVKFTGGVTIEGIIVTEEDPTQPLAICQLIFRGHVTAPGVDALPDDDPNFTEIKEHRGTVILAPGFHVDFRGNTGPINGIVAGDTLSFSGNSSMAGDLGTGIVALKDGGIAISGSAEIRVKPIADDIIPAGFKPQPQLGLSAVAQSYTETPGE